MLIVDGHQDLAFNAFVDGRDYLRSAYETRRAEEGGPVPELTGTCMLGLPEALRARVAVTITTLTAIPASDARPTEPGYRDAEEAHRQALEQLRIYHRWRAEHPQIALVSDRSQLEAVLRGWSPELAAESEPAAPTVGLILLIENADIIREPAEVPFWYDQGVRLIGPAWQANRYTGSSLTAGPLTDLGRELLAEMERAGMILDLSHMSDEATSQALDRYAGPVVATHANPRSIIPWHRMLSDTTIKLLVKRDGIVGIMPLNWALVPGWKRATGKESVHLDAVVAAIDAVCQLAGDASHIGIGSDFDGGQGAESAPAEIDTIADLPKLATALADRGYRPDDVEAIMSGNWLRFLQQHLPAGA